ncbi:hypothetical protein P153DRAFT_274054, partial [Dothidotthia symphoricarpi CBS 119687]
LQGDSMEVSVIRGNKTAKWNIPKALLSHHSEFFRKACNETFKEGFENKIVLPDCEPRMFQIFVQWIYFDTLPEILSMGMMDNVWRVFHLWVLGDRILAKEFKNMVMEKIYKVY